MVMPCELQPLATRILVWMEQHGPASVNEVLYGVGATGYDRVKWVRALYWLTRQGDLGVKLSSAHPDLICVYLTDAYKEERLYQHHAQFEDDAPKIMVAPDPLPRYPGNLPEVPNNLVL